MRRDEPRESLGALLARVRGEQGISQLRLAQRLCAAAGQPTVTRHEVSRWEREERIPTGYWLTWLAAVLDVPLTELERAAGAARATRRHAPAQRRQAPAQRRQAPAQRRQAPAQGGQAPAQTGDPQPWSGAHRRAS